MANDKSASKKIRVSATWLLRPSPDWRLKRGTNYLIERPTPKDWTLPEPPAPDWTITFFTPRKDDRTGDTP